MGTKYKSTGALNQQQFPIKLPTDRKSMKCWLFVHNIVVLRINAQFPPFPMPSSNLIGFGTLRLEATIFVRVTYLFIMKVKLKVLW